MVSSLIKVVTNVRYLLNFIHSIVLAFFTRLTVRHPYLLHLSLSLTRLPRLLVGLSPRSTGSGPGTGFSPSFFRFSPVDIIPP